MSELVLLDSCDRLKKKEKYVNITDHMFRFVQTLSYFFLQKKIKKNSSNLRITGYKHVLAIYFEFRYAI